MGTDFISQHNEGGEELKKREYKVNVNFVGRETPSDNQKFQDAINVMLEWCDENQEKVIKWANTKQKAS